MLSKLRGSRPRDDRPGGCHRHSRRIRFHRRRRIREPGSRHARPRLRGSSLPWAPFPPRVPVACAGSTGTFTVVGGTRHVITTVDVTTTTTFKDSADATPSFLDVCVGSQIGALGALSSGTLTATSVLIVPAR